MRSARRLLIVSPPTRPCRTDQQHRREGQKRQRVELGRAAQSVGEPGERQALKRQPARPVGDGGQKEAGDDGGALGAALYASNAVFGDPRLPMTHAYYGPQYTDEEIEEAVDTPPQTTRAKLRGEFISAAQEAGRDFTVDWVHLKLNDQAQRTVLCKDPFRSVDERVKRLIASM